MRSGSSAANTAEPGHSARTSKARGFHPMSQRLRALRVISFSGWRIAAHVGVESSHTKAAGNSCWALFNGGGGFFVTLKLKTAGYWEPCAGERVSRLKH